MSQQIVASESEDCNEPDLFTPEFKRLKAKKPFPDLSEVTNLDRLPLTSLCISSPANKAISQYPVRSCGLKPVAGLKPCEEWKCFQFLQFPGFVVIRNPFLDGYQRYWVYQCLQSFPSDRDNVTNMSVLGDNSCRYLWQEFVQKESCTLDKQDPLRKLRWTTLGYHYNWTTKEYSEDSKAPFPPDVNCLSQYLAACLGYVPYQAEAAIVNYYHLDSTLAGHTDHSEIDQSAPLFSISFGQTAIFQLGGKTKSVAPISIFLESGDICVMSGECRLAYHAVPKILTPSPEKTIPSCFQIPDTTHHAICDCTIHNTAGCNLYTDSVMTDSHSTGVIPSCGNVDEIRITTGSSSSDSSLENEHSPQKHCSDSTAPHVGTEITTATLNNNSLSNMECLQYFQGYNSNIDKVNFRIEEVVTNLDFRPFEVYLRESRINLNVRQVLPPGWTNLQNIV
uniref:Fe2OG dioxygenase domain-containing protein n=2 Tax=Arion vulgaris TaxID=1028688 RepID=A0A0B6ZDN0_9EUPU